jgi:hypothetical protein
MSAQFSTVQTGRAAVRPSIGAIAKAGLVAVVLAVVANLAARGLLFALFPLPAEFPPFGLVPIAMLTAVGVSLGVLVYGVISRVSRRPARTFTVVALIALVLSILPNLALLVNPNAIPFPFPGASSAAFGVLILFHVIAAAVTIAVMTRVERAS